jgi:predicted RNase H-like nuclease
MATRQSPRPTLAPVAGADGCPGGWICAVLDRDSGEVRPLLCRTSEDLLGIEPEPVVLAIDMPIGLAESGDRECDRLARSLLGPRRSSVFPAPNRPALSAVTQRGADAITRAITGKGVHGRAWGLYRRVLSLDLLLDPRSQGRVVEVHPELAFFALNGERPLGHSKHDEAGVAERRTLIDRAFGPSAFPRFREAIPGIEADDDDLLDALAASWTALRIAEGTARRLPDDPPTDAKGLRMEMWF